MPDWLTHIIIGAIFAEVFNVKKKSLVLLGSILPDLLPKLVLVKLFIQIPNTKYLALTAFHSPFVLLLASMIIAPLFRYKYSKVILLLNLGALTHFLADATLKHFTGGVIFFYPISLKHYTLNAVWPNHSIIIMIPALIIYVSILFYKKSIKKK